MIPDIKYKIGDSFQYLWGIITIGLTKECMKKLTKKELLEYLSDGITHEYIHHILTNMIDDDAITSKLFDTVAHYFENFELDRKVAHITSQYQSEIQTWKDSIDKNGIEEFKKWYHLTKKDIVYANKIANKRRK